MCELPDRKPNENRSFAKPASLLLFYNQITMERLIKYLALIIPVFLMVGSFVVFSFGQTKRRIKKPIRKPTVSKKTTLNKKLTSCLASSNKQKPEIYVSNSKTKQKYIISDCEPMTLKTIFQPKPQYPKAARFVKVSGTVKIDVVFDETGKVIWAKVVEGHPLLRAEALRIACLTRIKPPRNCLGQPRKVNPILTYNFTL
jgi:TonB family protein